VTSAHWVLPVWGRDAVTAERLAKSGARRRHLRLVAIAVVPLLLVGVLWGSLASLAPSPVAHRGEVSLWRTASGLLVRFPFNRPAPLRDLEDTFTFGGSAPTGTGYAASLTNGLSVGVRRHARGFAGWFASTRAAFPATGVYHVVMAKPPGAVRSTGAQGEAVFAVQTGTTKVTGLINYVVVASTSYRGRTRWSVGYAQGHIANAHLYRFVSLSVPPTTSVQNVTIQTDGRHRLAVWFGNRLVFASNDLHLDITPPFQSYLEVQSRLVPYTATFQDFWVTRTSTMTVSAPDGARIQLVTRAGATIAAATARKGAARLVLPPPQSRGVAELVVEFGGRSLRLGPFAYAGGDQYRLSGLGSASSPRVKT
jgi:hypothetical protein